MCIQPGSDHPQFSDGDVRACEYAAKQGSIGTAEISSNDFQQYTIGGVTSEPPNGTMGLPYWALRHFSDSVESTTSEEVTYNQCCDVLLRMDSVIWIWT